MPATPLEQALAGFQDYLLTHQLALLMSGEMAATAHLAQAVFREYRAEIARLRSELDAYQGRRVLFCTEAQMDMAALQSLDEDEGTIIRATDTGRELVLSGGTWEPR